MIKYSNIEDRKETDFPVSDIRYNVVMTGSAERAIAVPAEAKVCIFSAPNEYWVNYDATATVPTADIFTGSSSERNPGVRLIDGVSNIHLESSSAQNIQLSFFS